MSAINLHRWPISKTTGINIETQELILKWAKQDSQERRRLEKWLFAFCIKYMYQIICFIKKIKKINKLIKLKNFFPLCWDAPVFSLQVYFFSVTWLGRIKCLIWSHMDLIGYKTSNWQGYKKKLRKFYFTIGSQDQLCLKDIQGCFVDKVVRVKF